MEKNKVISIVNQKGGVGKTTTALNLSSWLSLYGKRKILIIDIDGQSNLTACINVDMTKIKYTIFDVLTNDKLNIEDTIYKDNKLLFDVIVADDKLNNIDLYLNSTFERERQLFYKIESIKKDYDFIIIDCSPSLNLATINSLVSSDYILIPVQSDYLSIRGTAKLMESINKIKERMNPKLELLGVFVTMFDNRKINDKNIYEVIHNQFKEKAFNTFIRENVRIKESPMAKQSIFEYDKNCNGYLDYYNLCIEIWKRLGGSVTNE